MVGQELQQEACPKWLSDLATHKSLREQRGGRDPQVVQRVCKEVRDCDVSVRLNATRSLGSITPHCDHDVINTLLGQDSEFGLNDVSSSVRAAAAEALGVVASGTNDELVCELLVRRFEDADWAVRSTALNSLVQVSKQPCAEEWLLDRVLETLHSGTWGCKTEAAEALGLLAPKNDKRVLDSLTSFFQHTDWAVRKSCATAVGRVAECGNRRALHAVLPLLGDADWRVRKAALEAVPELVERGCEEGVSALVQRLDDTQVGFKHALDIISPQDEDVQLAVLGALSRVTQRGDARVLGALAEHARKARAARCARLEQELQHVIQELRAEGCGREA